MFFQTIAMAGGRSMASTAPYEVWSLKNGFMTQWPAPLPNQAGVTNNGVRHDDAHGDEEQAKNRVWAFGECWNHAPSKK